MALYRALVIFTVFAHKGLMGRAVKHINSQSIERDLRRKKTLWMCAQTKSYKRITVSFDVNAVPGSLFRSLKLNGESISLHLPALERNAGLAYTPLRSGNRSVE
jgi:hypothetical protein